MRRKSLIHAASWVVFLLVLPASTVSAGTLRPDAIPGTSYVFHAFVNAVPAQGIGVIRADQGAGTLIANLYFRKLAPSTQYRISVNARACGSTTTAATHATAVFPVTSDAKGEVFKVGGHALGEVAGNNGTASLSIWEAWSGATRRICVDGFDVSVAGPNQTSGTCLWLGVIDSSPAKGIYTGDCNNDEAEGRDDGFFFSVPAANHQYRVTINGHPCSQNTPNQNVVKGFKVTSDASARIFSKDTPLVGFPRSEFSVSIYDGWFNQNRVACMKGTNLFGNP